MRHLRPYWAPLTVVALLLGGLFVTVPWYYRTYHGASPERGLEADEIAWVAGYAPWSARLRDGLVDGYAQRFSLDGRLGRVLDRASACEDELRTDVGSAPTARLGAVTERAGRACQLALGALAEYRAADDTPNQRTSRALAGATLTLDEADLQLRRLLLVHRTLPELHGPHGESRIEPRFGYAISDSQPPEVRCWSVEEWPQVHAELGAVGLERDEELVREVNAYRYRIHASPALCATLTRAAYPDGSPPPAPEEVAEALLAVLHASRHAVAAVEDERTARCDALRGLRGAAVRLGASADAVAAAEELARGASRCPQGS